MKNDFWNSAFVNGLLLAFVSVIFILLQTLLPGSSVLITLGKLVATVGVLYYFMRQFSQAQESFSYGEGFKYGFTVSFCSAIALTVYTFVHNTYLFPEQMEAQIEAVMQVMERVGGSAQAPQMDLFLNNMSRFMLIGIFLNATIMGLIAPAILANFTKKEQPLFTDSQE